MVIALSVNNRDKHGHIKLTRKTTTWRPFQGDCEGKYKVIVNNTTTITRNYKKNTVMTTGYDVVKRVTDQHTGQYKKEEKGKGYNRKRKKVKEDR